MMNSSVQMLSWAVTAHLIIGGILVTWDFPHMNNQGVGECLEFPIAE
jgi:hypothetical protein